MKAWGWRRALVSASASPPAAYFPSSSAAHPPKMGNLVFLSFSTLKIKPRRNHEIRTIDDAVALFDGMICSYPRPSIVEFNKLLGVIVRMKNYDLVISLYNRVELEGIAKCCFS